MATVIDELIEEAHPGERADSGPSSDTLPSLDAHILAPLLTRIGLIGVAAVMAHLVGRAADMVAGQQIPRATSTLDQLGLLRTIGIAIAVFAVAASGWWVLQVDRCALVVGKFHRRRSPLFVFSPVLLLVLFVVNDHVDLLQVGAQGPRGGVDLRPGVMALIIGFLMWAPSSRLNSAVSSMGAKMPIRTQAALDAIAVGIFWMAWSRTKLAPTEQLRAGDLSRMSLLLVAAVVVGLLGTAFSAIVIVRTKRVVANLARLADMPERLEIMPFVVQSPASAPDLDATRRMIPLTPWRWAVLASYAVWIASHLAAAVTYLQIRGLLDAHASAARIDHQIGISVIVGLIGFGVVFLAQWAWVIVIVTNANRATVHAPSIALTWVMASMPLVLVTLSAFWTGAARVDLLFTALLLALPSFFLSFNIARKAVASVRGDVMSMGAWRLAVSMCLVVQYFANVVRPPTPQQLLLLCVATAVVKAGVLLGALRVAARVTTGVNASLHNFHQVKRLT